MIRYLSLGGCHFFDQHEASQISTQARNVQRWVVNHTGEQEHHQLTVDTPNNFQEVLNVNDRRRLSLWRHIFDHQKIFGHQLASTEDTTTLGQKLTVQLFTKPKYLARPSTAVLRSCVPRSIICWRTNWKIIALPLLATWETEQDPKNRCPVGKLFI